MEDIKRLATTVIGLPTVVAIMIFANNYIVDAIIAIIAIISLHEYFNAISKKAKPIRWIGYAVCISIAFIHIIPMEYLKLIMPVTISCVSLVLFLHVILTEMKVTFKDVAYTFFGITYAPIFLMYLAVIRGMDNGRILIWYVFICAWATDIFAYLTGRYIGTHHFSKISPHKTIEGCIGGIAGASVIAIIYTFFINQYFGLNYSYLFVAIITAILSAVSQVGDFAASSIKRYVEIKDYGELIPGHGGMLDRIDSLLFIAPFAYVLFSLFMQ